MQQLKRIPLTELKIHREFVAGAPQDPAARAMLSSSISLAKELGLTTVAEGVETKGEWCLVARGGVDAVQGYFVARPMPATEMEGRSEEHTSELQSLMRSSYAVFCLKKQKITQMIQR